MAQKHNERSEINESSICPQFYVRGLLLTKKFTHFAMKTYYGYSLELAQCDNSNEYPQHVVFVVK